MTRPAHRTLQFGPFELDVPNARLLRGQAPVEMPPRAFDLLCHLATRPGQLVTKEELLDQVWGRRFITEAVIKTAMSELRAVLGDDARAPRYVETVARRGYRFVAPTGADAGAVGLADADASEAAATAAPPPAGPSPVPPRAPDRAGDPPDPLPAETSPLIGREQSLADVEALVQAQRVLTIAGPGGVGKTRLALALARRVQGLHPDGVRLLELAALPSDCDAAQLRAQFARALRLSAGAGDTPQRLAQEAAGLGALLLLDNAEHLVGALAEVVGDLLARGTPLVFVVTSQEPLGLAAERVYRLPALALPPLTARVDEAIAHASVQMLVERIGARLHGFTLTPHQAEAATQLCRLLDGLPLAIELASARVPVLGLHGLLERLQAHEEDAQGAPHLADLALLAHGAHAARDAAPRHRSLRGTLAWSHALLRPEEQRVFRRLAVFRGGFRLDMAESVCADGAPDAPDTLGVLEAISGLQDKSFIDAEERPDGSVRLRLLEAPRAFAAECLQAAGEAAQVRERHALAVRRWIEQALAGSEDVSMLDWLARHQPDADNLDAALRWAVAPPQAAARTELASALLFAGSRLWLVMGVPDETKRWLDALRAAMAGGAAHPRHEIDDEVQARLDRVAAELAHLGRLPIPEGYAALERAQPWIDAHADAVERYRALNLRYVLTLRVQPEADRRPILEAMRRLEQPHWSHTLTALRGIDQAHEDTLQGRRQAALAHYRARYARLREVGYRIESWVISQMLMATEVVEGRAEHAVAIGQTVLAEIRAAGLQRTLQGVFTVWLQVLAEQGHAPRVRLELREHARTMLLPGGRLWNVALALPWLAWHEGRTEAAARLLGWRDAAFARVSPGAVGPFTAGLRERVGQRLAQALEAETLAAHLCAGSALDDAAALDLALAE